MMYNDRNGRFLKLAYTMATDLLLAACSQNEFSGSQGDPLPEGKYSLQISSVSMSAESSSEPWNANAPQTRVAENTIYGNSSHWTDGDKIGVQIGDNTETSVYTVKVDVTSLTPETPLYWKSTTLSQTVKAWYPTTGKTIDLADQSSYLAYVLAGMGSDDYKKKVSLTFTHALAKVRVKLEGYKANDVTGVQLYTYTSCTNTQGMVSTFDAKEGWIKMKEVTYNGTKCWEANVVPDYEITKFKINDATEGQFTTTVTPQAAKVHVITIDVKPAGPTQVTDGETITKPGDYIMTGSNTQTVTLNGDGINLTLKDVNVAITGQNKLAIDAARPSPWRARIIRFLPLNEEASRCLAMPILTIKGASDDKSANSLIVTVGNNGSGDASCVGIGVEQKKTCGNIILSNVTLTVTGGKTYYFGGATIGTSSEPSGSNSTTQCGDITITNSSVDATGGASAAAIGIGGQSYNGSSKTLTCGAIKIEKSDVKVTIKCYGNAPWFGAGIGTGNLSGAKVNCGKIILDKSEEELAEFTKKWAKYETGGNTGYKIGKGYSSNGGTATFGGVYLKGNDTGTANYADGWGSWQ